MRIGTPYNNHSSLLRPRAKSSMQGAFGVPTPSHAAGGDRVQFGATTPGGFESNPRLRKTLRLQKALTAIQNKPGSKNIRSIFDFWERNKFSDKYLLTYIPGELHDGIYAHAFPPETVKALLDNGLQEILDEALENLVDFNARTAFLISNDSENFSAHHVGRSGSIKFLPVLERMLESDNLETRHTAYGALTWMGESIHPETSLAAKRLVEKHAQRHAMDQVVNERFNAYGSLHRIAMGGTAEATEQLAKYWDKHIERKPLQNSENQDTILRFLHQFTVLLAGKAPGAEEMLNARKSVILPYLEHKIAAEPDKYADPYARERHQLWKAALYGESTDDLPARELRPEQKVGERVHTIYEDDGEYYKDFPDAVAAMAARNVPGAAEKLREVEAGREQFWTRELEKLVTGNMTTFPGKTEPINYFQEYSFRQHVINQMTHYAGPRMIPVLERVMREPWRKLDHFDWRTQMRDYTDDKTAAIKARLCMELQLLINDIKARHNID